MLKLKLKSIITSKIFCLIMAFVCMFTGSGLVLSNQPKIEKVLENELLKSKKESQIKTSSAFNSTNTSSNFISSTPPNSSTVTKISGTIPKN